MSEALDQIRTRAMEEFRRIGVSIWTHKPHAGSVGRILRAHLLVESSLRNHIQAMNPNLGPIEELGLSFDKLRTAAVHLKRGSLAWANEDLVTINKLRNKLAHKLDANISMADVERLSDVSEQWPVSLEKDPATVVEVWVLFFGIMVSATESIEEFEDDLQARHVLNEQSARLLHELFDDTSQEKGA